MPNIVSWFYIAECCRISRGLSGWPNPVWGGGEGINPMWRLHNYSVLWFRIPLKLFCLAEGHPTLFVGYNMFLVHACDKFV